MSGKLSHQLTDEGVTVVLRPDIGSPSSLHITTAEARRFAWAVLADVDPDGASEADGDAIVFGRVSLDPLAMLAWFDQKPLHLTMSEWRIVELLVRRGGRICSRDAIMEAIYGPEPSQDPKIVDVYVCKVRNKLRALGGDGFIESEWGKGYRLVLEPFKTAAPDRTRTRANNWSILRDVRARLESGPTTFLELCALNPRWNTGSVRAAVGVLMQRRIIENIGSAKNAVYQMREEWAA